MVTNLNLSFFIMPEKGGEVPLRKRGRRREAMYPRAPSYFALFPSSAQRIPS
jgi:hypothetical protein